MFEPAIWNAWLLSLPFFALGAVFMGSKRDVAERMADMTGYTTKEKFFTIAASVMPYPFMITTVWTPFTTVQPFLYLGLVLYLIGIALFTLSLKTIVETPPDELFLAGPYRFTRNPMYVAATIVFMAICLATANIMLAGYLIVAVLFQHFMILAEERICRAKYGADFNDYLKRVPRYLFI